MDITIKCWVDWALWLRMRLYKGVDLTTEGSNKERVGTHSIRRLNIKHSLSHLYLPTPVLSTQCDLVLEVLLTRTHEWSSTPGAFAYEDSSSRYLCTLHSRNDQADDDVAFRSSWTTDRVELLGRCMRAEAWSGGDPSPASSRLLRGFEQNHVRVRVCVRVQVLLFHEPLFGPSEILSMTNF